ncbi:MAG TPA: arginine--tRNA ligase, partial [Spirochaetota bacterium]|nr:arginine--tRNA ligase [Spirochaetota bacterium]
MQRTTLFKEKLKTVIKEALLEIYPEKEEYFTDFGINIEYPDVKFGDYASPVAMQAAKIIKKPPMESGSQLKNILQSNDLFAEVKLVKPGFLNFYMSASALETVVKNIEQDKNYGRSGLYAGQKILLEFVSANPTGPLHIGHGRWAVIGDVLANILNFSGAAVEREFYINDTGEQIKKLHQTVTAIRDNRPVPEDGYHGKCMQVFRHNRSDPVTYFLNEHKKTLTDINTFFDRFFPESELHQNREIEKIFTLLQSKNVLYEKDKALWFKATAYGDEKDRVLRKADGSYSYFGVDIAYHMHKLSRQYDKL